MNQEKMEVLDNSSNHSISQKLWSIRLLIIGVVMIVSTFLIATFWEVIGLTRTETIWLAISLMVSFGINLAGFIIGFLERKKNPKKALIGIIGNGVFVLLLFSIVVFSISLMSDV